MKPGFVLLPVLIFIVGLLPAARGELTWAQKTVDLSATAGTEVLEARFKFTNTGSTPVDIRQVESSCGCTTTELAQRHYEPGASGEIVARYTVGGHMGLQRKTVAVSSSDQTGVTTLTLLVHIPEVAHLQPAFVTWEHDEVNKPKVITMDLLQDIAPKDVTVQSSNSAITVELKPLVERRKYQLIVTPAQTGQFLHAILTVHCQFGDKEQTFRTYATIQPPLSPSVTVCGNSGPSRPPAAAQTNPLLMKSTPTLLSLLLATLLSTFTAASMAYAQTTVIVDPAPTVPPVQTTTVQTTTVQTLPAVTPLPGQHVAEIEIVVSHGSVQAYFGQAARGEKVDLGALKFNFKLPSTATVTKLASRDNDSEGSKHVTPDNPWHVVVPFDGPGRFVFNIVDWDNDPVVVSAVVKVDGVVLFSGRGSEDDFNGWAQKSYGPEVHKTGSREIAFIVGGPR